MISCLLYPLCYLVTYCDLAHFKRNGYCIKMKKYEDVKMCLPLVKSQRRADILQRSIFMNTDFHEREELFAVLKEGYLRKGQTILDIGANIGNHTVFFSKIAGADKVFAFEPITDTYRQLVKNVEINNLNDRVKLFNTAVGEDIGKAEIESYNMINIGATHLKTSDDGSIDVISIDSLKLDEHVDFVKIDVEGFEVGVIKGMTELLRRDHPILWIEIFDNNKEEMTELLNECGYSETKVISYANYIFTKWQNRKSF